MAILRVNGGAKGVELADRPGDARLALTRAAQRAPEGAPIVILIHGFKYDPDGVESANPHGWLYGERRVEKRQSRRASWPHGLGFTETGAEDGLCVAFAWQSRPRPLATLLGQARNHFSTAYERAPDAAEALLNIISTLRAARPDAKIDLFCHSLGARVALLALKSAGEAQRAEALGRVILLGGAVFTGEAESAMAALGRTPVQNRPQVFNIISRENDLYDALFELFAPRPRPAGGALGRKGLGARRPDWIDLQLDHPDFGRFLADRGARLASGRQVACHWSFYTRPGAMRLYRRILRKRKDWSISALRSEMAPEAIEPRWTSLRFAPSTLMGYFPKPYTAARPRRAAPAPLEVAHADSAESLVSGATA